MPYTYNTGNPVGASGSTDPRDLIDNAQVIDQYATATEVSAPDRLGVVRKTWAGLESDVNTAIATYTMFTARGAWVTATAYALNDVWTHTVSGDKYLVLTAYTSGANEAADIAGGNVTLFRGRYTELATSLAELSATPVVFEGQAVDLTAGGRSGQFIWTLGDFSAEVAADTLQGVYVASDTVAATVGCWVRKTDFYTLQMWGVVGDGTDESESMQAAATSGLTIHVTNPPVYYSFKDVRRAKRTVFIGSSKPLYTPDNASEFVGMSAFVLAEGGTYFWVQDVGQTKVLEIEDTHILYYGRGPSTSFSNELQRYNNTSCGYYNMLAGLGVAGYSKEIQAVNANCYNNQYGIRNPVDSKFIGGNLNVNTDGVSCQTGSNGNEFHGVRVEFNTARGYVFFGAIQNNVIGGLVDRSQNEGAICSGSSDVTFSGTKFNRNGVDLSSPHISTDNSKTILNGISTKSGNSMDDGSGVLCPTLALKINSGDFVGVSDCDLTGVTSGSDTVQIVSNPDAYAYSNNYGLTDASRHDSTAVRNSRHITEFILKTVTAGSTVVTPIKFHKLDTYRRGRLNVNIVARDASTGSTKAGELAFYTKREGGSSSITFISSVFDASGTDVGVTATEDIQVTISNIATDCSSFDIELTNNIANTLSIDVDIY